MNNTLKKALALCLTVVTSIGIAASTSVDYSTAGVRIDSICALF